jgi:hypothetical protein
MTAQLARKAFGGYGYCAGSRLLVMKIGAYW